jgi:2-polyprenyl-6-methoxyphenol hydroxylase-like FAD-dependent oxidoreductase
MSDERGAEVLIAGAGPTGLVLALWLNRLGVRTRIIDRAPQLETTSRAVVVQARTLELYQQVGLARSVVQDGRLLSGVNFWSAGRRVGRLPIGDIGQGLSPFPFALMYPQDTHERLLIDALAAKGLTVERGTELVGFTTSGEGVEARLRRAEGHEELCRVQYLAGCDGAHSRVREVLGVGFPGGTYAHVFYVADAQASGPLIDGELHVTFDEDDFLGLFPLPREGWVRLIGTVREGAAPRDRPLAWEDVSQRLLRRLAIDVVRVNWFSTYHVHHRAARAFRRDRVFLLGDAAHIHSPVGGQGMNTGIGDAVNLSWKLAAVLGGRADPRLLNTYEEERMPFARRLLATTDRLFELATSPRPWRRRMRADVLPRLVAPLFRVPALRRLAFRTVSQTAISYRDCHLNAGRAGKVHGGDRLPWVAAAGDGPLQDNYRPLADLRWQVHVYGKAPDALVDTCRERDLPLRELAWRPAMGEAGLARDAAYLVRPDGYVCLAVEDASAPVLARHLDDWRLRAGADGPPRVGAPEAQAAHP